MKISGKHLSLFALACVIVLTFACFAPPAAAGAARTYLFSMDTAEEISKFDNDNTGAKLALTKDTVREGAGALKITPSGSAPETKLAMDLSEDKLKAWIGHDAVGVHVYIPKDMKVAPNTLFVGMADLSKGWEWVDGVFAKANVAPGWNDIVYELSEPMKNVKKDGHYKLYFSFFKADENKEKIPLTEAFCVDGIWVGGIEAASTAPLTASGEVKAVWTFDYERQVVGYDSDGTGATFELAPDVVYDGSVAIAVVPSGTSAETKMAVELSGDALAEWIGKTELVMNVYLPPENRLNPNGFFLGMGDLTNGWGWVDGTFSETKVVPGWNKIKYALPEKMSKLNPNGKYKLYFSYYYANESNQKTPLTEKFYVIPAFQAYGANENGVKLLLNLTFTQDGSTVAYLPLTLDLFTDKIDLGVGNWYFSYATDPVSFWVSNNDRDNVKKFASLGDPLGIGASLGKGVVMNAKGQVAGADVNLYGGYLNNSGVMLGRLAYELPAEFTLGLTEAYTFGKANDKDDLTFGADLAGTIPGLDTKLNLAGAGYWKKADGLKLEDAEENYAFLIGLNDLKLGPAKGWAKYTAVGPNFNSWYKSADDQALLNKYAGHAAAEAGVDVNLPTGVPASLSLGDTLWMKYSGNAAEWNEVTGKVAVEPLKDLKATVSGAYKSDIDNDPGTDFDGYKARAEVSYNAYGLNFNPYAEYCADSYADKAVHKDNKRVDTAIGLNIKGDPVPGLTVGTESKYIVEDPTAKVFAYGIYSGEMNPGAIKNVRYDAAGVASYNKAGSADPEEIFYSYAGAKVDITDALYAKLGVLTKDEKGSLVSGLDLNWKISDKLSAAVVYTHREKGLKPPEDPNMWKPFDDDGKNWLKASVVGAMGDGTLTLSYGVDGRKAADTKDFHAGKPWAYLRNYPSNYMDWQLVTISVRVPF